MLYDLEYKYIFIQFYIRSKMNYTHIFLTISLAFCVLWVYNTFVCLVVALVVSLCTDVHAIWRKVLELYFCKMRRKKSPKKITDRNVFKVICLLTDVDTNLQLTSGRLLRECNLGHTEFWVENFVHDILERLHGEIKVDSYHLSYTYPIQMFETFEIIAEVIYWDDSSFYMKQTVVRNRDKKECATILSIHRLTYVTTYEILEILDKDFSVNKADQPELVKKLQDLNKNLPKQQ